MGYKNIGNGIEYDDEQHRYRHVGKNLPSVTTIIGHRSPIPKFLLNSPDFQRSIQHGKEVHDATEYLDALGEVPPQILDMYKTDGVLHRAAKWTKWQNENVEKILFIELGIVSARYGYCGRVDRVAVLKDGRVPVIDLKSGDVSTSGRLQVAAYIEAFNEMKVEVDGEIIVADCGMVIGLKGDEAKVSEIKMLKHFSMFIERLDEFNKDVAYDTHMGV
ncbi:MAG: hypothetical protein DRR06_18680 [Gammaproteobacteria bacterium]|nr:MAG: hypothetical protein DRR06_18680 [Gammaproteobacteria bacterium]